VALEAGACTEAVAAGSAEDELLAGSCGEEFGGVISTTLISTMRLLALLTMAVI
jgi:hypothetical protein